MATTTNYGFEVPDDTDLVKDGAAAMRELGQDVDTQLFTALGGNYPGLRLIKKQTVGTGVSSVTVTDAFSATYDNYRIVISGVDGSSVSAITTKFGAATTAYYYSQRFHSYAGTPSGIDNGVNVGFLQTGIVGDANETNVSFDVFNPFLSFRTTVSGNYFSNVYSGWFGGTLATTTSYTSIVIAPGAGTLTGGTISIYGYGAS